MGNVRSSDLLVVDWAPNEAEGDKVLHVFDGSEQQQEDVSVIKLDADELLTAEFHPTEAVDQLLIPRLARRVKCAITARRESHPQYLEHGEPLTS
ncbi:hypothetical protein [Streptomyces syringium]|uniref:Macrodomain Ter protein organizer (MatP/YcbG family) n=1 Tax=Streptomyces syringium TaxID=76729 RepID=A0ABS4Y5H4_9ACTN|nr:hypothetical protein [Streptomyces syringium]MBP2403999.1 macrodomain Ter protein organizer (MatP/YcbG family) [Streptomyces syringium]